MNLINHENILKIGKYKKISLTNINNLAVTRGSNGAVLYDKNKNNFINFEAFADKAVYKIGAEDAILSVIALFFKYGITKELSLLCGSLAATQSAMTTGNKKMVSKTKIIKTLQHLLK